MLRARRTSWREPMPGAAMKRARRYKTGGLSISRSETLGRSAYGIGTTVTLVVCVTVWPSESVAVTVMVAVPP